ncbi:MAG: HPr family phosphocarrier protein [Gammaproteobacteria bacterium]|nr:HPr family phosphocarrier protein [Gammaproteobacteria bacterium]MBL6818816.1 HPr family phosphocarrier protein [Gammaproteobacteria bacterium]MBL6898590.1 HPr family phosphocarrier protein [Gammaproteobacteria bacterium]
MISKNLTILNKLGLHARAAAKLVALSNNFKSEIILVKDNKSADARSIMKLLMLSASKGSVLEVKITGKDQEEAMGSIEKLFLNGFDEAL